MRLSTIRQEDQLLVDRQGDTLDPRIKRGRVAKGKVVCVCYRVLLCVTSYRDTFPFNISKLQRHYTVYLPGVYRISQKCVLQTQ